jgi:hypothetical protein
MIAFFAVAVTGMGAAENPAKAKLSKGITFFLAKAKAELGLLSAFVGDQSKK